MRSPSYIIKWHMEIYWDSMKYDHDYKKQRSVSHLGLKIKKFSHNGLFRNNQNEQEMNSFETSPISDVKCYE